MWDLWCTKWYGDRSCSEYFSFPLPVSFENRSLVVFTYMLSLGGRYKSETWETFKNNPLSENGQHSIEMYVQSYLAPKFRVHWATHVCTSTPSYSFMAWCVIKQLDTLIFTITFILKSRSLSRNANITALKLCFIALNVYRVPVCTYI
jgi:hypothetical protein